MSTTKTNPRQPSGVLPEWAELVRRQAQSLRYGVVEIVVHDSQVTQIEKTERVRLGKPDNRSREK